MVQVLAESIVSDTSQTTVKANEQIIFETAQKYSNGFKSGHLEKSFLIRSNSDKFDYRLIQLENGIKILLVSDPSYKDINEHLSNKNLSSSSDSESDSDSSDKSSNASSCSKEVVF